MADTPSINDRVMAMLHARTEALTTGDAIAEPLIATSVFHLPNATDPTRVYGRIDNPTVQAVETRIGLLENAPTLLFPSGMATYGALSMAVLKAGDAILLLSDGYYAARAMYDSIFADFDIHMRLVAARDIAEAPLDGVKMVLIETPSNPTLDLVDIATLAGRCRKTGSLLVVDNTVCTPLLQQPLDLGADVVISSDTKAMSGHSDVLMGHISSRDEALMERVQNVRNLMGAIPGPFEAWLLLRGLETLELRLSRMCANADAVLPILRTHAAVKTLHYPASNSAQMAHPGFLIGVTFADTAAAGRFIDGAAPLIPATSFGGLHSSADRRARWGDDVEDGFLRLSLGCEPEAQLLAALTRGLDAV